MREELTARVKQYMIEQGMVRSGERVLLALSGGGDSVCLAQILSDLSGEMGYSLFALHVHHGIRGASADADEAFCEAFCRERGIPFRSEHVDVPGEAARCGTGIEETARTLRYRALEAEAERIGAQRIAAAHHLDDQAETVLLQLVRGSGLSGLAAMRPVTGRIIRPLLAVQKEEILSFLREAGLAWREDETNEDLSLARNRMRRAVMPELKAVNAQAARHLAQAAETAAEAADWLAQEAEAFLAREGVPVPVSALREAPAALRREVLRRMAPEHGKDLARAHILAAEKLLDQPVGRRIDLPGGAVFVREYETLRCCRGTDPDTVPAGRIVWERRPYHGEKFPEKRYTKWMDYDRIGADIAVRTRRRGDWFLLADGSRKSVSRYMIDEKIPARDRDRILLVTAGSHVLWIVGHRMCDGVKIGPDTREILVCRLREAEDEQSERNH